jgi:phosphomannomutase/phosphoglucomutase
MPPGAAFAVGGDVRRSTPGFLDALAGGLCEAGLHVLDLGIVPTPLVYFARRHLDTAGCAIVTASHSPPYINGLKWMVGDLPPSEEDVQALGKEAALPDGPPGKRPRGQARRLDVTSEYQTWLKTRWGAGPLPAGALAVIDPGNGSWAGRAVPVLEYVFPAMRFAAIHDRPDGGFPDRNPDCARPEYLARLAESVRRTGAALGVAFDGDGDRVAFVDDQGTALTSEQTTWILLRSFGDELRDRPFVYDLKFSDRIPEAAERLGARPTVERSGHAFIRTRMIESRGRFGAEISGHYFFEELHGGDDGLFAALRLMAWLGQSGKRLSQLRCECPPVFITSDLRLAVEVGERERTVQAVRAAFRDLPQTLVDGVRVDFPNGWALLRSSVTEAKLTFRFEGKTREDLQEVVRTFCQRLPVLGERLYQVYESQGDESGHERSFS